MRSPRETSAVTSTMVTVISCHRGRPRVVFVEASSTSQVSAVCRSWGWRTGPFLAFAAPPVTPRRPLYAAVAGGARWVLNVDVCGLGFSCPHASSHRPSCSLEPDGTLTLLHFEFANVMEATTNDHYRLCKHYNMVTIPRSAIFPLRRRCMGRWVARDGRARRGPAPVRDSSSGS